MAIVYTNLTLGLTKQNSTLTVEMPLGDTGRGLDIFISDDVIGDDKSNVDDTLSADLWVVKPSGLMVSMSASSVSKFENTDAYEVQFSDTLTFQQVLAEEGVVKAQLTVNSNNTFVSSFKFNINVVDNIATRESIVSDQTFQNAIQVLSEMATYKKELEEYIAKFKEQMKLTVNVRAGTDDPTVLSTDTEGDLYIKYEEE